MSRNVLWLANSSDVNPRIPEELRVPNLITKRLSEEAGEDLTAVVRALWPSPALLGLVGDWLERYEPVAVVLHVNSYWFTYESAPGKVRRIFGPVGKPLASAGLKAAAMPSFSDNPLFKAGRKAVVRAVGGDLLLPPRESLELFGSVVRRVVSEEDMVLLVRGPLTAHNSAGTDRGFRKALRRRVYMHRAIQDLCAKLHVT